MINQSVIPRHIAIVMDGNGRWAQQRRRPRLFGHHRGAEAVRSTVKTCGQLSVECLTLFAFSSENWKRPEDEVKGLMTLLATTYIGADTMPAKKRVLCLSIHWMLRRKITKRFSKNLQVSSSLKPLQTWAISLWHKRLSTCKNALLLLVLAPAAF